MFVLEENKIEFDKVSWNLQKDECQAVIVRINKKSLVEVEQKMLAHQLNCKLIVICDDFQRPGTATYVKLRLQNRCNIKQSLNQIYLNYSKYKLDAHVRPKIIKPLFWCIAIIHSVLVVTHKAYSNTELDQAFQILKYVID